MGKLALLFVMVAILGGSLLTYRARINANETEFARRDVQGDHQARDAATSGHGLVMNAMLGMDGFKPSLGFSERFVQDGRFTVDSYAISADADTVSFTITGHEGGAAHTIRSTYEWDEMNFPGPLWMDVPYVTGVINPGARIDGGPDALPSHFDKRRYDELSLSSLLPFGTMSSSMSSQFAATSGNGGDFLSSDMLYTGLLDDLNTFDATDLYYAAVNAMDVSDATVPGPAVISTNENYGSDSRIVRVTGSLEICGGSVQGTGALVIEGRLTMTCPGASLQWSGLVIVHTDSSYTTINVADDAILNIDGALVIDQVAMPPGGHLDFTVMREDDGSWSSPGGTPGPDWGAEYPWYQHKHKFDQDPAIPEIRTVYFAEQGADRHEAWTNFRGALDAQGSSDVYLEVINRDGHGYATYSLDIAGQPEVYNGTLKNGFGDFSSAGNIFRTQSFQASDLRTLVVDVRSLRMLEKRWDTIGGCTSWPFCIGNDWGRQNALVIRMRRSSNNAILYDGTLYWHMRGDEVAADQAEENALRADIEAGASFGTHLVLGQNSQINFDIDPIEEIGYRLAFDGDEVISRGMWTNHVSAADYRSQGVDAGVGGGPSSEHPTP